MLKAIQDQDFAQLAPAGYYVALRVGFAFPMAEFNAFPQLWVDTYTAQGFALYDPVMHWVHSHTGASRWSDLDKGDPRQILKQAADHGLRFGVAISCLDPANESFRSFGTFARADREYALSETAVLAAKLQSLHDCSIPPDNLTQAELEALAFIKKGRLLKEIACDLDVTEGAIKQRLRGAKRKLRATNSAHAVSLATKFGLI